MQKLRIRYKVPISKLNMPSPVITRDSLERIIKKEWQYNSFYVQYNAAWVDDEALLLNYTQTISDGDVPSLVQASDYGENEVYATRGSNLTGATDTKEFTVGFFVKFQEIGDGSNELLMATSVSGGASRLSILRLGSSSRISFSAKNSSGSSIFSGQLADRNYTSEGGWVLVLLSVDAENSEAIAYVNDDEITLTNPVIVDDIFDHTHGNFSIAAGTSGSLNAHVCMSGVLFHNKFIDISDEAIRRKIIDENGNPSLFDDGTDLFGEPALISAPDGNLENNLGSGGNFTNVNELVDCEDTP